jgi:hypothetical protein
MGAKSAKPLFLNSPEAPQQNSEPKNDQVFAIWKRGVRKWVLDRMGIISVILKFQRVHVRKAQYGIEY